MFLRQLEGIYQPRGHSIQFEHDARIIRNVRRAVQHLHCVVASIRTRTNRQGHYPSEITKRREVMLEHASGQGRARFRHGLVGRFLDFFFHRGTAFGIAFGMGIGRQIGTSS